MEANPPGHARTLRMPFTAEGVCRVPGLDRGGGAFEMIDYDMVLLESRKETENKLR
jgi:hypothetical protein